MCRLDWVAFDGFVFRCVFLIVCRARGARRRLLAISEEHGSSVLGQVSKGLATVTLMSKDNNVLTSFIFFEYFTENLPIVAYICFYTNSQRNFYLLHSGV